MKDLIRQLIEKHYELLSVESRKKFTEYLPAKSFLVEYRTISIGTGRQTGKTTLIAEMAKDDDLIITYNKNLVENMKELRRENGHTTDNVIVSKQLPELLEDETLSYDRIFVDNADFLREGLDFIYDNVVGRCNQLILIRG